MPLIESHYKSPFWLRNGHLATIIPSTFRQVEDVAYERERIITEDNDFLDIDWLKNDSDKLVVISHGLEGSSERPYVKGMAKYFAQHGWEVVAWNCRSCSGEINKTSRFYHHGATDDLDTVIKHALKAKDYKTVALVGFSMGGSLTTKYISERGSTIADNIMGGVAFSMPVSLKSSVDALSTSSIKFYQKRFLKKLEIKVKTKAEKYPELVQYNGFEHIKSFIDFDNEYTAPLHGFKDAFDFYEKASAGKYMHETQRPILFCNALNDPFLGEACYPFQECRNSEFLYLETPDHGGHVGFTLPNSEVNYMEVRALEFLEDLLKK
ncbi:YheT family hydrolase [Fulvivirga lutimaris]|uniref:YheT family hydrolase n=1 Tax=Fulvivirga lutimaris TaxID=1819566 RepID=UPI0012BBB764|nr:alpha/beta fold hydrolase [Fulvivirga lutimaris]MTI40773.1 alpha/beta fold hydrolase [Fulvivirga lutimaris]